VDALPAWINPLDIIIVFALLGGTAWGFVRGLVRMALNLAVLYIAAILAMTFYDELGAWLKKVSNAALSDSVNEAIAFIFILIVTSAILIFVLRRTYKDTELPGIRQIDQLGGLVIGFFLTAIWIGLAIIAFAFTLRVPVTGGEAIMGNVAKYFRDSNLIPIFYQFLPVAFATLKPWMPRGQLPEILTFRLF
jgi:uncharacterized membrane protein required for colicin V production